MNDPVEVDEEEVRLGRLGEELLNACARSSHVWAEPLSHEINWRSELTRIEPSR